MRLIATLFLAALATACATPDEAEGWTSDSIDSHESALTRSAATAESAPAREEARVIEDDVFAESGVLIAEAAAPAVGEAPGDDGTVSAKRVPVRVEISRDHIHVEWNDGSQSDYCYNQETGQYQAC